MKKVSAAQAKAQLAALVAEVAYRGEHIIIERRGKPLAALVSIADLERLEQGQPTSAQPRGPWPWWVYGGMSPRRSWMRSSRTFMPAASGT